MKMIEAYAMTKALGAEQQFTSKENIPRYNYNVLIKLYRSRMTQGHIKCFR